MKENSRSVKMLSKPERKPKERFYKNKREHKRLTLEKLKKNKPREMRSRN